MKFSKKILCLNMLLATTFVGFGQPLVFTRANTGNPILVPADEIWQITSFGDNGNYFSSTEAGAIYNSTNPSPENLIGRIGRSGGVVQTGTGSSGQYPGSACLGAIIPGPAAIVLNTNLQPSLILDKLSAFQDKKTSGTFVIPENSTNAFDIKIEKSSDQITWLECLPGSYPSSTNRLFFRLRLIAK